MNTLHCDKFWVWFFAVLWWPFWKWKQVEILRCRESIQDIIIYLHMKFRWNRTMLNLWGIVVAILKMATGRNFSMSGINLGHHNLPTYEMSLKLDNVENFALWQILSLIFCGIVVAILKMATGRNFSMSGINSGHHYVPTYQILMTSDNVEFLPPIFIPCFGSHFQNGRHLENFEYTELLS
jgi:hypothetical protein